MSWEPVAVSFLIAVLIVFPLVAWLGWRRPRAGEDEGVWLSAVFLFSLLFLALWASAAWLEPWGPVMWGVPWLGLLLIGLVVAMLMVAASWRPGGTTRSYASVGGAAPEAASTDAGAAEGFGLLFWILIGLLLLAAIFGTI